MHKLKSRMVRLNLSIDVVSSIANKITGGKAQGFPAAPEFSPYRSESLTQLRHFSLVGGLHRRPLGPSSDPLFYQPDPLPLTCAENIVRCPAP